MDKKTEHLRKAQGKYIGAGIKLNNHEYGHKKAKNIAIARAKKPVSESEYDKWKKEKSSPSSFRKASGNLMKRQIGEHES